MYAWIWVVVGCMAQMVIPCAHAFADAAATAATTASTPALKVSDGDLASAALFGFGFAATLTGIRLLWKLRRVALGRA